MIQKRSFALTLIKLEGDINYNVETGLSNLKVVLLAKGLAKLATLLVNTTVSVLNQALSFCP